ncbi:MAG TPA: arsenite methyltransferase [Acidimicrobiia bacterium]|jgi:SAM-dependent methyltransferase
MSDTTASTRDDVRRRYADAALSVGPGPSAGDGCCDDGCCGPPQANTDDISRALYEVDDLASIPSGAALASLGCGNPIAVAELQPGETVLDLGSGGGIDVLLSAKRVGPTGFAYGLDMTPEMLELAHAHQAEAGATNVEFLQGYIEEIPLPDAAVDVVISNCVVNLSADKPAVFREIARVLRRGGRIGITDIVAEDHLTAEERLERGSWAGCIAGALGMSEYTEGLRAAGLTDASVTPTHAVADGMHSAIIRAVKV